MKLILTVLFLMMVSYNVTAQKLDLNKVTKAELQEKQHKTDTSAAAAILFKNAKTAFKYSEKDGFTSTTVFQIKLKIYKKEGVKWADFKIPYYIGYENLDDELVDIISGYTYNLEGDKVVKTKVTGESKFREKLNENWGQKSITFPNVKVGSIIELEYKFKSQNILELPDFQYQYEIPVDNAQYRTEIPEYYIYNALRKGYVEVESTQKLESTTQSYDRKANYTSVGGSLSFNQIVTNYSVKDVPALKEEEYVNNINNYYGTLEHELKLIRYPDQPVKQKATTWEAVASSIFEQEQFKNALSNSDYFINDARLVIHSGAAPEENIRKVFHFVKSRMNWNGGYGYYPKAKMSIAYANKVGNVAEINLLLVAMLRMAGVDANPVLVSTRANGIALFPTRALFNYVIAAVKTENGTILLDATSKHSDVNILPVRVLNSPGRLITSNGTSEEIDLIPKLNSKDNVSIMANINQQGEVSGKIREQYFDYHAMVFRERFNGISKESYIEKLEKKATGLTVTDYVVQNNDDLSLPIIENYSFASTNSVEGIGGKMYVSPFLFFALTENPFKQDVREYPVDFVFPKQYKFNISLTVPEGYAVETLPQAKALSLPDNLGNFKYVISNNGNQIQLLFTLDINQAVITPDYYEALKSFYKEMVNKQTEKIVLKKT